MSRAATRAGFTRSSSRLCLSRRSFRDEENISCHVNEIQPETEVNFKYPRYVRKLVA